MKISLSNNQKIILYKILKNILNTALIAWLGALLIEILIPGFISSYLSFSKIIVIISIIIFAIYWLSKDFELAPDKTDTLSKIDISLGIISTIFIADIASINFPLPIILVIIFTSLIILFYFYKNLFIK